MNNQPVSGQRLLVPVALVTLFIALLLFLLNLGDATAQDGGAQEAPAGAMPLETPHYLPMIGGALGSAGEAGAIIPDQYIVVLQPAEVRAANGEPRSAELFAAEVVAAYGGDVLFTYSVALEGFAAVLPERAIAALVIDPSVAYIEPDRTVTLDATQSPATWGIDRIDQRERPLSNSYTYNYTGAGVHAYIIDTGIVPTHNEFAGRVGNGFTAINSGGTADCNGHGTHVAGTVGGMTYGVAKAVTLHPVRVLNCQGRGSDAGVIAGLDWVAANRVLPAVANLSLGGAASTAIDAAVRRAVAMGVTVVVAAGNANTSACNSSPAREPLAITVGATTNTDMRASYSNYGGCLDLFAPGTNITSAWHTSNSATYQNSGTSMAAPHVAGAAALYLQGNPGAAPATVASALIDNASTNRITSSGTGSPNRLLFVGFLTGAPLPTSTPTRTVAPATATALATSFPPTATNMPQPIPTLTPVPSAGGELLANGNFEAGRSAWSESSSRGYVLICNATSCGSTGAPAHSGAWRAWLGGANSESAEVRQQISVPPGTSPVLSFWYWVDSSDWCGYDFGHVTLTANGQTTQIRRYDLCTSSGTNGWVQQAFALPASAGGSVIIAFRASTDASFSSSFHVDDVSVRTDSALAAEPSDNIPYVDAAPLLAKPDTPAAKDIPER